MPEAIKITMLGYSGAGKTCYMVAMYKMMSYGIGLNGFSLSACDADDNVRFGELWKSLAETEGVDRWPAPTGDETFTYNFNFNYSFKPLLGFNWFDYRGGALEDYSSAPDVGELRQRLTDTSCIFLCVSGEHFSKKLKPTAYDKIGVGSINQLMTDTQNINGRNLPPAVVVVITKYDLCSHRPYAEVVEEIRELFGVFFGQGTKWLVMICPITLGQELATDANLAEVDPENVHLPVVFAMYAELLRQSWILGNKKNEAVDMLNSLQSGFMSKWIQKNNIAQKREDLDFVNGNLEEIQSKLFLLSNGLRKNSVSLFFNGREVRLSDFFL
jgi:hypothetical protein